jgi:hypothetical protein
MHTASRNRVPILSRIRMRVFLLLAAVWTAAAAQESRPAGLVPAESPLAPIQEALLRGDSEEARSALDALTGTAPDEILSAAGPQIALFRAATEPVATRAAAMLAVASAFPRHPVAEAAVVAGLAALLSDGPEVGDLAAPLLSAGDVPRPDGPPQSRRGASAASRDVLLAAFVEILEVRAGAADRDRAAVEHAQRLLAQFPAQAGEWTWVRPGGATRFPAQIDGDLRLRFYALPGGGEPPDPSRLMLPPGPPRIDVALPPLREGAEVPALAPGAWLVVASGSNGRYRRAWPVMVSDLEIVAHSIPGNVQTLALLAGRPADGPLAVRTFESRIGRSRNPPQPGVHNAVIVRAGDHVAIAPIATPPQTPQAVPPEPRIVADLWAAQPVYRPSDAVAMRLVVRPLRTDSLGEIPVRIVFWPRQPHEVVLEERLAGVKAIGFTIPTTAPAGPVRVQVFDVDHKPAGPLAAEPVLDLIAFTVQPLPADPVQVLLSAPASWKADEPSPRVEVRALYRDGAPASGLIASVDVASGSFRQQVGATLDDRGTATVVIDLEHAAASTPFGIPPIDVTARLLARDLELARASRRIEVRRDEEPDAPALSVTVLTARPVAGENLEIAVTGPPGEAALLTAGTATTLVPHLVEIDAAGRARISVPTAKSWWPSVDLFCSTRELVDPVRKDARGRPWVRGRLERHVQVALARPDAPAVRVVPGRAEVAAGGEMDVALGVTSSVPLASVTLSVAVVDAQLLEFAGVGGPDPEASLRPRVPATQRMASGSPAPVTAALWYQGVLGRDESPGLSPAERRPPIRPARTGPRSAADVVARDVGAWELRDATAFFDAVVPVDADGRASIKVRFPDRSATWRVVAVAIDGRGASAVATANVRTTGGSRHHPPAADTGPARTRSTHARVFVGGEAPESRDASGRLAGAARPARLDGAASEQAVIDTYPHPRDLPRALADQVRRASEGVADHLAARVLSDAADLFVAGSGRWSGPRPESELETSGVLTHFAALRDLKTKDGWAWARGGATDFEVAPLVLHALSASAELNVDASRFGVLPALHDGFLRSAPTAFGDALANPQAALDLEDLRSHPFRTAVPGGRQALVLVETVIGVLAVDPANVAAKTALATLMRQTYELPRGLLARAGRALARAGDRESALVALERTKTAPVDAEEIPVFASEAARLACELDFLRIIEASPDDQAEVARRLARACAQETWPRATDAALARAALTFYSGDPNDEPVAPATLAEPGLSLAVSWAEPALFVVERVHDFGPAGAPPSGSPVPSRRLFACGPAGDPAPRPPGTPIEQPSSDGAAAVQAGALLRIEVDVELPEGRSCAVDCPVPPGTRILLASGAAAPRPDSGAGDAHVVWLFRAPHAEPRARLEAWVVAASGSAAFWPPCSVVALDTLETLGFSSTARVEIPNVEPASLEHVTVPAFDRESVRLARERIVAAIEAAPDDAALPKLLEELALLPDPGVRDALLRVLPKAARVFEAPASIAPVLVAVVSRHADLWSPALIGVVNAGSRRARLFAEAAAETADGRALVARWRADEPMEASVTRRAATMAIARMKLREPSEIDDLWDPALFLKLLPPDQGPLAEADAEQLASLRDLPFQRAFSLLGASPGPAAEARWRGWVAVLDRLARRAAEGFADHEMDAVMLVTAISEPPPVSLRFFTEGEAAFAARRAALRRTFAQRALALLEARALPIEAAALPLFATESLAVDSRLLTLLQAEIAAGRGEAAVPVGAQILERRRDAYPFDDPLGPRLAAIAVAGPRPWRLPALRALAPGERERVPLLAIEQLLRDPETTSAAIDLLVERDDAADLMRTTLEQRLPRYEARRILERLFTIEERPFGRTPLARLLGLVAQLDAESARSLSDEIARRAEEGPAELAAALASSRDERVRELLLRSLARVHHTDVPWDATDPGLDRVRTKLMALAGDEESVARIRTWMAAAMQASQTQGASESVLQDLWPYLAAHALPSDVMTFGPPSPLESLASRSAQWTDDDVREFLRSPDAQPDPGSTVTRFGSVAVVARLIGPDRAGRFADEMLALWRAHVDAGLAFDALSLFGQMGTGQVAALEEVLAEGPGAASRPRKFDANQKLAYVAALRRDPAIERDVAHLRDAAPDDVARALARYALDVTGHWKEPSRPATRAQAATGPQTPQDWQRVLTTRLRNEGLAAIASAEPPVIQAWEKTLRERGLLVK